MKQPRSKRLYSASGSAPRLRKHPLESIQQEPWSFITLAAGLGLAAGFLLKYKGVRKALRIYRVTRRFV